MGIHNKSGGSVAGSYSHQLCGRYQRGFQMQMAVNKSRTNIFSAKIPFFFARRTGYPSSKNSKKEGIEPLASISVPQMMMNPVVSEKIRNYIEEQMAKRVEVELINSVVGMQQNVRR